MRAISVRQPWAWAIVHGGKNVENRTRRDPWRGAVGTRLYVHSSGTRDSDDAEELVRVLARYPGPELPPEAHALGALVGTVRLAGLHSVTECVGLCSPWARVESPWHLELTAPRPLSPAVPWRGALGLFHVSPQMVDTVTPRGRGTAHG